MSTVTINYGIRTSPDGKSVTISVQRGDQKADSVVIDADAIAPLVVGLLGGAIDCAQKIGKADDPLSEERNLEQVPFVAARGIGLYDPPDKPNVIGMSLIFGQTEVGIGLPRAAVEPFANALLASTADTSRLQ